MSWLSTSRSLPLSTLLRTGVMAALAMRFLVLPAMATDDALLFHIECPPDTTVSCDAEIWDLSGFGTAYIYGYGGVEPAGDPASVVYDLNDCGAGTIVRTWIAYDYSGHQYSCSQTIYVSGGGYLDIHWPPNYTISACGPSTDPEDLPPPYNFPVITNDECAQIMFNYEDQVFNINPPACLKILRKWTVIDWCQYDPNDWHPSGIWEHTQVIKVVPENPPTIVCPADITATAGGDCTGGYVSIPKATGMADCGAGVTITNNSPFASQSGADASGFYPLGTTKVTFTASDGCGGKATCSMYVTVKDMKAPTPICYYGISIALMQMPDGYYMDLRPEFFDKGSFDNCTPDHKLLFDIEPKRVDCSDIGTIPVKVFVTDASGNSAYCNTIVNVQDNLDICPPTNGLISGAVMTPDGLELEDVMVELQNSNGRYDMTDSAGSYTLEHIPFGVDYAVSPASDQLDMAGVTVIDLVVLLKHVAGVERITDPYLFMAADVDGNSKVDVHDLLGLKDLIIQDYYNVPTGTEWTFVDAAFAPNATDPFGSPVPHAYPIQNFSADMNGLNFIGIKVGDISGDMNYSSVYGGVETRSTPFTLTYGEGKAPSAGAVEIPLYIDVQEPLQAFQFALELPKETALLQVVPSAELPGCVLEATSSDGRQSVAGLWYAQDVLPRGKHQVGWLVVDAASQSGHSAALQLALGPRSIAYDERYQPYVLALRQDGQSGAQAPYDRAAFQVGAAFPNPFSGVCHVPVAITGSSTIRLDIIDASGRVVLSQKHQLGAGDHLLTVRSADLPGDGLYIGRLTDQSATHTFRLLSQTRE